MLQMSITLRKPCHNVSQISENIPCSLGGHRLWNFLTTARLCFLNHKDAHHRPTSFLSSDCLTETPNSGKLKSLLQLYKSFALKHDSYFSNLHQPDRLPVIYYPITLPTHLVFKLLNLSQSFASVFAVSHMSARRHFVVLWACWAMEKPVVLSGRPAFFCAPAFACKASSRALHWGIQCCEMCRALLVFWWWSDLLPEASESQYDKTGAGDSWGHCVAISVYMQAYTPHDEDENMAKLVSNTPVLHQKQSQKSSKRAAVMCICS